ncbi:hypothetical protein [Taibaiella koreensis]|uniref:hypothetical protein n=1 Tax=Taibaiella koreensis TaxID=1268548 RepID=UPI000E59C833|nr:hypothetical protein [Taibaiella koreensis]
MSRFILAALLMLISISAYSQNIISLGNLDSRLRNEGRIIYLCKDSASYTFASQRFKVPSGDHDANYTIRFFVLPVVSFEALKGCLLALSEKPEYAIDDVHPVPPVYIATLITGNVSAATMEQKDLFSFDTKSETARFIDTLLACLGKINGDSKAIDIIKVDQKYYSDKR